MADDTKPVAKLAVMLSTICDNQDILFRYSMEATVEQHWTVWKADPYGREVKDQIGHGSSLTAAIQSAFDNTTRDIMRVGGSDA